MKTTLLLLVLLSGCVGYKDEIEQQKAEDRKADSLEMVSSLKNSKYNPCKDTLYLSLKSKPLASLTEREYQYFVNKEKECAELQKAILTNKPNEKIAKQYESNSEIWLYLLGIGAVLSIISYAIYASEK